MVKGDQSPLSPISARSLGGSSTISNTPRPESAATAVPLSANARLPTTTSQSPSNATATTNAAATISPVHLNNPTPNGNATSTVVATTAAITNNNNNIITATSNGSHKNATPPQPQHIEYNPRWKGYMYILLSSLINFASISNIRKSSYDSSSETNDSFGADDSRDNSDIDNISSSSVFDIVNGTRGVALSFSIVTFVFSFLIVLMDRLQICSTKFHFMKSYNGSAVEGVSLVVGTIYSIVAVSYVTQVRGIAYLTLNIYFSAWLILISFIYTLNKWSTAKDILSIAELTGISTTLKSWYVVFISSLVVTGTSLNMLIILSVYESTQLNENANARAATLGIVFGFCSTAISFWMILSHYNFIECTNEGGWFELLLIIVIILIWIIATAVMTTDNSIAATISGSGCYYYAPVIVPPPPSDVDTNSTPIQSMWNVIQETKQLVNGTNETFDCFLSIQNVTYSCDSFVTDNGVDDNTNENGNSNVTDVDTSQVQSLEAIPGSNLYIFLWINLLTSFHLVSRWKAQQALQFARTQQQQQLKATDTAPSLTTTAAASATLKNNNGRLPKNNTNSSTLHSEDAENDDVEHANDNDDSDDDIVDFDDDDRY